jgi:enamine deaminase RidA (YjgF/YER057c/UK114 family)
MSNARERLRSLGLALPAGVAAAANYVPAVRSADVLYLSGQIPRVGTAVAVTGCVGDEVSLSEARRAAQICALRLLSVASDVAGSLDDIEQVLELKVYVRSAPTFGDHSEVADAASDLLVAVLGDKGRHARTAVGVAQLPRNAAVEISAVMALLHKPRA